MGWMRDEGGLEKGPANFVPLTPLSHLRRAAQVFPAREALVCGARRWTYAAYHADVSRMAGGLAASGIAPGEVVATLMPNRAEQVMAHFAVPACGAVLNTINVRLDAETVAYILEHGEARALIVDGAFLDLAEQALALMGGPPPEIIEVPAPGQDASGRFQTVEHLMQSGAPDYDWVMPEDEWESLALNYTSGTTGRPKGVVYHHRGAYLMTMGTVVSWQMVQGPRFMAVVPLFHCNGWCHSWMMPLLGGCVICCRDVEAGTIYRLLAEERVSHFGGAPIVLNLLINATPDQRRDLPRRVSVMTAGAPPAAATLAKMADLGLDVMQVYGLTETYGHVTECLWDEGWETLPPEGQAALRARQGVAMPMMEEIAVYDPGGAPVPRDGKTQGEIGIRGNCVMKGYLKNPEATAEAFSGGHFHSGDLAVQHGDGHIQIVDRAKDIIISGGENVSSVEVEGVLMHHPDVSLCAVVAQPDDKWGEVPCAFVEPKPGAECDEAALIAFARERLAGFKTPKRVLFGELPKTSTGKIQKFELRRRAERE